MSSTINEWMRCGVAKTRKDHGYQVCFIQTCGCLSGPCRNPCGRCNRRPAPRLRSEVRNVACHRSTCGLSAPLPRQPTVKHHPSQNRARLFRRHTRTNYRIEGKGECMKGGLRELSAFLQLERIKTNTGWSTTVKRMLGKKE